MSCQNLGSARQNESTARGFSRYCAAAQARSLEGTVVQNITEAIMKEQKNRFKINYSLACVLRNIETNELRYFHTSYNNHLMLKTALLISNRQELLDFLNSVL